MNDDLKKVSNYATKLCQVRVFITLNVFIIFLKKAAGVTKH